MLAGCSSLLSPRHRLRSEASNEFQACHFQLPSMNTQRLDLPCSFPRKDGKLSKPIRSLSLPVEKSVKAKGNYSLKQKFHHPPSITGSQNTQWEGRREIKEFWEKRKNLKRFAEQYSSDESRINRAKRKKRNSNTISPDDSSEGERLSVSELGSENFWCEVPQSISAVAGVPSDLILPPPPLLNNSWVDSVVTEITDKGDKDAETSEEAKKTRSESRTSSESHSLIRKRNENSSENETGNGYQLLYPSEERGMETYEEDVQWENQGFELLSLLVALMESISSKDIPAINDYLARLGEIASPKGTPISRVTAYFTEALALRVARIFPHIFHITIPREIDRVDEDMGTALRLLNHTSPIPKFLHFTANEMILKAFEGRDRVHIIDFDINQGLQWPGLFQSLASRLNPPSHVRITGIGESKQELQETGDRLARFAEALNLPFEFHAVVDRLEDVRLWMLHVKEHETVAINCILQLHKMLYDENGAALRDMLSLIRSTNPTIVLVAEQEAIHNNPSFERRVSNSLKYYSAIFDSIDSSLAIHSPARIKLEEMYAREIRNIVACEGSERVERHESFENWRKLMETGGFKCAKIGEREMLQSQMLLKMYSCENYCVEKQGEEDGAAITLKWLDQPLYTVSAWTPLDITGSSSSFSQPD